MPSFSLLSCLSFVISLASAIQFTSPVASSLLTRGSNVQLSWSSVDTDPTSFSVYLWNFKYYPPFYTYLKTVNTADLGTTITVPCDVISQDGYQFNAISGNNVYVIYAQSPQFSIDSTVCSFPTVGSNPEGCGNAGQGGVLQTVTSTVTAAQATITVGASTVTVGRRTGTVSRTTVTSTKIVQAQCPPCYRGRS